MPWSCLSQSVAQAERLGVALISLSCHPEPARQPKQRPSFLHCPSLPTDAQTSSIAFAECQCKLEGAQLLWRPPASQGHRPLPGRATSRGMSRSTPSLEAGEIDQQAASRRQWLQHRRRPTRRHCRLPPLVPSILPLACLQAHHPAVDHWPGMGARRPAGLAAWRGDAVAAGGSLQ